MTAPAWDVTRIKNSTGSQAGIVTLANQSGISQTELDTILAANNAAPYVGAVASSPQLGTTQGLDEAGLEMPAAEVIDTTTTGTTTTPVEGIASLGQENKTGTPVVERLQ